MFVLVFVYSRYMKMKRAIIEKDIAVYGRMMR